jgi:DNA (cytosine-5)-methyltransferase 1
MYCAETLAARMEERYLDDAPIWDDIKTFDGSAWRGVVDIISSGFPCQPYSAAARGRNRQDSIWAHVSTAIQACEPAIVFLENVNISAFLQPFADLQAMGFAVLPLYEADPAEMGAPHSRRRFFLLAYADSKSELVCAVNEEMASVQKAPRPWDGWPEFPRMDDGLPNRVDRSRALGNAVVPIVAAKAFVALMESIDV